MKKLFLILVTILSLSFVSHSQKIFEVPEVKVAAGVSISSDDLYTSLEVGKISGKNTYSLIAETVDPENSGRDYFLGVKYLRNSPISNSTSFVFGGSTLVRIADGHQLTFRPEVGLETAVNDKVSFGVSLAAPVREGDAGIFKPVRFQTGAQLIVRL